MRVCFVVNNPRTQRASYTTLHLAFAAYRRGHDVAFASVDAFSQGAGLDIVAEVARPKSGRPRDAAGYGKALTAPAPPRAAGRPDRRDSGHRAAGVALRFNRRLRAIRLDGGR